MPKLEKFEVVFDQSVFSAGQNVSGSVNIIVRERMNIESLQLQIRGVAQTSWREIVLRVSNALYSGKNVVFDKTIDFWEDKQEIPSGTHSYPFTFDLPTDSPASFEGKHGKIQYFRNQETLDEIASDLCEEIINNPDLGFQKFQSVVTGMFAEGNYNHGRLLSLFTFGATLALEFHKFGIDQAKVPDWLIYCIMCDLQSDIEIHGDWVCFLKYLAARSVQDVPEKLNL